MARLIDLTGRRFGSLVVVERVENHITATGNSRTAWRCVCDCGNETVSKTADLQRGDTKSCGCLQLESRRRNATKHGGKGTRLYGIWKAMRRRCMDEAYKDYSRYGGRGISVCNAWQKDFSSFREWSMENGYSDQLTIDRIDVNGDYCPENCRWVNMKTQCNNRTSNRFLFYHNETHTVKEWSEITGIPYSTLYMRLRNGWNVEDALTNNNKNNQKSN